MDPEQKKSCKFRDSWLHMTDFAGWLEKSSKRRSDNKELAFCKICEATLLAHKTDLMRHKNSKKHQENEKKIPSIEPENEGINKFNELVRKAEIKLAAFIAENNTPFQVMDSLAPLCKEIFPDSSIASKIAAKRTKTTQILKKVIGNNVLEDLYIQLRKPGNFFSIIMDETTDQSAIKQCALTVIFMDEDIKMQYKFLDMYEMSSSTAENLYNSLKASLSSKGIPLENLVGFSSDTTNVMVGEKKSMFAHLQREFPGIACVKCSCHLMHLVACKATLKLPKAVEDLIRNLGSHFSRSYGRQQDYKEFQEFFHVEIHKILSPANTRWLSVKACVDRVLEQYVALEHYLWLRKLDDPSETTDKMHETITDPFTKAYLEFLSYILGILCDFNTMFQSEHPILHKLKPEIEKILKDICANFMDEEYLKSTPVFEIEHTNSTHYLPKDKIYVGVQTSETIYELKQSETKENMEDFINTILDFYVELVTLVKDKFTFEDELYNILPIVEPLCAQSFKTKSLVALWKRFPIIKTLVDPQTLDNEWRCHAFMNHEEEGLDPKLPADVYWKKVSELTKCTGEQKFPNLCNAMKLLLVLPFSNASVERIFSMLNNCKNAHRNRLKTDTLVALFATKEEVREQNGCVSFQPNQKMLDTKLWN